MSIDPSGLPREGRTRSLAGVVVSTVPLVLLPFAVNVASDTLPGGAQRWAWLSWPAIIVLVAVSWRLGTTTGAPGHGGTRRPAAPAPGGTPPPAAPTPGSTSPPAAPTPGATSPPAAPTPSAPDGPGPAYPPAGDPGFPDPPAFRDPPGFRDPTSFPDPTNFGGATNFGNPTDSAGVGSSGSPTSSGGATGYGYGPDPLRRTAPPPWQPAPPFPTRSAFHPVRLLAVPITGALTAVLLSQFHLVGVHPPFLAGAIIVVIAVVLCGAELLTPRPIPRGTAAAVTYTVLAGMAVWRWDSSRSDLWYVLESGVILGLGVYLATRVREPSFFRRVLPAVVLTLLGWFSMGALFAIYHGVDTTVADTGFFAGIATVVAGTIAVGLQSVAARDV